MKLEELTKDERNLLLYLECRCTDDGGAVDPRHMNEQDFETAEKWNREEFIKFGRISSGFISSHRTHWVQFSDEAWELAHEERRARAARMFEKRNWKKTSEV